MSDCQASLNASCSRRKGLPDGWTRARLRDLLARSVSGEWGDAPSNEPPNEHVLVRVIRGTEFRNWRRDSARSAAPRIISCSSLAKRRLEAGDLVVEVSGGGPNQPVGRTLLIREQDLLQQREPLICSNFCRQLRVNPGVNPAFVNYALHLQYALGVFNVFQTQTTNLRNLKVNDWLTGITLPMPPVAEQDYIVGLLDQMEQIRRKQSTAEERVNRLTLAVYATLIQPSSTEPWPMEPLDRLVNFHSGGTPPKARDDYWNGDIPWVSPKDMKPVEILDAEDHISRDAVVKSGLKFIPAESVLIVVRGMILAHTVPIRLNRVPVTINQDMKALLSKRPIDPVFLRWALQSKHRDLLAMVQTAAHGTKRLESERLASITVPVPPLEVQETFSRRATSIRQFQIAQSTVNSRLDDLSQAMLRLAFSGVLTTNWRAAQNDTGSVAVSQC